MLDLRDHTYECITQSEVMRETQESYPHLSEGDNDHSEDDNNDSGPSLAVPGYDESQGSFINDRNGDRRPSNLIIVSSTGIFKRKVKWCCCPNGPEPFVQLLRYKLFPASFKRPETAFTYEVLDHFHLDALECKTAAMNFMSKIVCVSNEAFPGIIPVRISVYLMLRSTGNVI